MTYTKPQLKDIAWHTGKALLCALQLLVLHNVTGKSVKTLMDFPRSWLGAGIATAPILCKPRSANQNW